MSKFYIYIKERRERKRGGQRAQVNCVSNQIYWLKLPVPVLERGSKPYNRI